jgi:hypothetical protein
MATVTKKIKTAEEVELTEEPVVHETVIVQVPDESDSVPEVSVTIPEETPQAKEVSVRVKPNKSFTACYGGAYYTFTKGVCMNVPENVKRIMQEGDLLLPL